MNTGQHTDEQLRGSVEARRIRKTRRVVVVGMAAVVTIAPLSLAVPAYFDVFVWSVGALALATGVATYALYAIPCPKCGKNFMGVLMRHSDTFRTRCAHCGFDLRPQRPT